MSLHVLADNAKRLVTLLGVAGVLDATRAYALLLTITQAANLTYTFK